MLKYLSVCFITIVCLALNGQESWSGIIQEKPYDHPNMAASLYQIGRYALQEPASALRKVREANMPLRGMDEVFVEVQYGWESDKTGNFDFSALPYFKVQSKYRNLTGGWIPVDRLLDLSRAIPDGYIVRAANTCSTDHEGITVTNAQSYQANGATGQGLRIAIIDFGFGSLGAAQTAGTAPAAPVQIDFTASGNPFASGTNHGTGCTEIIFEYATGATYFLYKIAGQSQLGLATNQAIADDIDIIAHSASYFNTGWGDGSGAVCAAVKDATDAGILYFHGAGNFHRRHWQGDFKDDDGDLLHEFSGTDAFNAMTIANGNSVTAHLQWKGTPSISNDFDLYLFDAGNNVIASSNGLFDYESLSWTNNSGGTMTVSLAVLRKVGTTSEFELFAPTGNDFEYGQTGGATASPANSTEDFCITVGAVNWNGYDAENPTIEPFSSWGPTNGGIIVPDLCAPDGLTLTSYPGGFFGASAGGPNVAGITAILWSEHTYLSADGILKAIYGLAELYNDFGLTGHDIIFGRGGVELPDFTNNSRFIYKNAGNTSDVTTLPFITIEQANTIAPPNTHIFFMGGTYDAPAPGQDVLTTPMTYRSLHEDAVIK